MSADATVADDFALLVECWAAVTDPRFARGKVHPLPGVLGPVVLGLLGGGRSLSAISRYGRLHPEVLAPLGLRRAPSVATLHRLLHGSGGGGAGGAAHLRPPPDGAAVRGGRAGRRRRRRQDAAGDAGGRGSSSTSCRCSPTAARWRWTRRRRPRCRARSAAAPRWVAAVAAEFPGLRVLTGDALFAEADLCRAMRGQRPGLPGPAQKNQPTLLSDAEPLFAAARPPDAVTHDKGHGRLERCELWVSADLGGYSAVPGLRRVGRRKRVVHLATGEIKEQTRYLLTSLGPERAPPPVLLALLRGHWGIENRHFHVKDDSSARTGRSSRPMPVVRCSACCAPQRRTCSAATATGGRPSPLTARAEWVNAHPSTALARLDGL